MAYCEPSQLTESFDRDGFVNGGMVLSDAELCELRSEVERFADVQFRDQEQTGPLPWFQELGHDAHTRHYRMIGVWRISDAFRRLINNQRVLTIAAALIGAKTLQPWVDTVQYKPPRHGGPCNWHQDAAYHRNIEPAERLLSVWIALDDADEESGCMWMVPGSHKWGNKEHYLPKFKQLRDRHELARVQPDDDLDPSQWRNATPCAVQAGEVHFHHAYTWHSSPTNRSARVRRGYTIFYTPDGIRVTRPEGDSRIRASAGTLLSEVESPEFPILFRTT